MKITVFYVGASLLAPLRRAESDINKKHDFDLRIAVHNCGGPLSADEWRKAESDLGESQLVFIIHVTDSENASRIKSGLESSSANRRAVIAFNCMPELMRETRMGKLDFSKLMKSRSSGAGKVDAESSGQNLARKLGSWMADFVRGRKNGEAEKETNAGPRNKSQYVKMIGRLPAILKFIPTAGRLRDVKNYLLLFCYFLQPTNNNIRSMLLLAIKQYVSDSGASITIDPPETMPAVAIYHPDAPVLFETFEAYRKWYEPARKLKLDSQQTIGLLLMRPQIISDSRRHYDKLISAIESEGLACIPAISTFMDNRDACRQFLVEADSNGPMARSRVSQVVSLTGFSFVGGPAMNDSESAVKFFSELGAQYHSMVSLDVQTIENWRESKLGLNPIQTAMQVAIPELDGATEAIVFGGLTQSGDQPEAIEDRCQRIARRLARWNKLRVAARDEIRLAFLIFCFPPNKGNIGTAADLDVFPSLWDILANLKSEGYRVALPDDADHLRKLLLEGNSEEFGTTTNIVYRMNPDEYRRLCPYADEIEREWGRAPGTINSNGREILIPGIQLGSVFIGAQPTFGYEGDPMRLLMAESGAPHHGFMAMRIYLEKIFKADALIHVGTHGATEFMPGKQVGLSKDCWPDRLIGDLPNVYIYSVNNPSEGTIARRRSYAELISYLTPPIENAGLYKEFVSMKDLLNAYRQSSNEAERAQLFQVIEEKAQSLNL